jgi:hypothetical protein
VVAVLGAATLRCLGREVVVVGAEQACLVRCGEAKRWCRAFIGVVGRFRGKSLPGDLGVGSGRVDRGGRPLIGAATAPAR